ncbi:MAG: 50S ribosomal protein L25/general stress protein Ctc [Alphaproteobacteria bacterium]|nr:50S ribosomal protein L25/general stress protein Ctc [Alphaproteobacteria bacterium]
MTNLMTLKAELRNRVGKGSSRAARRANKIPAVIYGDKKEPLSIAIEEYDFFMLRTKNQNIFTKTCEVEVDGKKINTLIRDIQYHPVTDEPLHVDFLRIGKNTEITIMIPLKFVNEELSPGIKKGGVLNIVSHEIELTCKASQIPENIIIDLDGKDVGDSIHFGSIKLPKGCTPSHEDESFTLAAITAPSALKSKEGAAGSSNEEETEAGEEAAE